MTDAYNWQEFYPDGVDRNFKPPDRPLWAILREQAHRNPDRPAIYYRDLTISYDRLWRQSEACASVMRARGYGAAKRANRVLIMLPNCPEFVSHYYGALRADLIVVAVSPKLTHNELASIIAATEPRVAIIERSCALEFEHGVRESRAPEPNTFYVSAGEDFRKSEVDSSLLPTLLEQPPRTVARTDLDPAVLQSTSGTTGAIKSAMMSQRNLLANAMQNNLWFGWSEQDVVLGALPLCHTWGMCCVMNSTIVAGACMALVEQFDAREVIETVRKQKVSIAYGSGTMFSRLLDAVGEDEQDLGSALSGLRFVKAGAMVIESALQRRWEQMVPSVPMLMGYGLTEASPEVCNNPTGNVRNGTVGVPLPGTDIRICDPENPGKEMPKGHEGEIQVRGPQVMLGYWNDPEGTREVLIEGGWLRTGDLGRFDPSGYLRIVDRLKDLIKFRGFSVSPSEVERVLLSHPSVAEAAVIGVPDPTEGEVPVAYIVLHQGAPLDVEDLAGYVEPHLASFKRPRRFHVTHEIPKNHVGKPLKRVLREMPEPGTGRVNLG